MKKNLSTILLLIIFLAGLSLLLYPSISDYVNSKNQSSAVAHYSEAVDEMSIAEREQVWNKAVAYNKALAASGFGLVSLTEQEKEEYESQLSISADGSMGYIEIPSISCILPIYHGTDDDALASGVGHVEGSSLPVGGESTHCVLSGHRGLPSAKLFTSLDELEVGDVFMLYTLGETLTYEVDQILIVLPEETEALAIVPGEDLCTLITCTPYGVNTHRLLVRGHRIPNEENSTLRITGDAIQIEPIVVAPFAGVPIFLILLAWVFRRGKKSR